MTLLMMAMAAALAAEPVPTEEIAAVGDGVQAPDTTTAAIVADCSARKFETRAEIEQDGQKRVVKIKLCAAKDGDDSAWIKTLEDAKAKIAGHPEISDDSKVKIVAELNAEIARIEKGESASISPSAKTSPPIAQNPAKTVSPPFSSPTAIAPVSSLAPTLRSQAKPRLTIRCLEVGEAGDGQRCISLERDTLLSIRAEEALVGSVSLRFLRRGDVRGEVALATMRQGQVIRSKLPRQLCAGVASSKVEIQILSSNQVAETLGPYMLRC